MRSRFLLSNDNFLSEGFARDLRETLLQDPSELADETPLLGEIVAQLCIELAYGKPSPWRAHGFSIMLVSAYDIPGRQCIQNLGCSGPLIDDLATTTPTK